MKPITLKDIQNLNIGQNEIANFVEKIGINSLQENYFNYIYKKMID